jgi:hypothetical protein
LNLLEKSSLITNEFLALLAQAAPADAAVGAYVTKEQAERFFARACLFHGLPVQTAKSIVAIPDAKVRIMLHEIADLTGLSWSGRKRVFQFAKHRLRYWLLSEMKNS